MIFIVSCSTKKNSFTRRFYHNLTSHYNAYFNGEESIKEGLAELEKMVSDNYTKVLPVFNYGKKSTAQSLNPYMDVAIEKASMIIQRHSMKFGSKEYVRWIDDSYLLIGKSYFYKQEYISARRTFSYVINEYPDEDIKYSAMAWLARTYNQMEEFEKSEPLLKSVLEDNSASEVPLKARKQIPLVLANAYILQEKYTKAIGPLERGIELINKRDLKTRLEFILGQIYQREGNLQEASKYYLSVIKRNPPYEMAFQAKINLARSYDAEAGDRKKIVKTLEKMLKDAKNKDYLDQIYYALAEVMLTDDQDSLGKKYLRLSVATSESNNYQKTMSSLKVANIYFDEGEYELAAAYFDTAVQVIPNDYPDLERIKNEANILSELVKNIIVIEEEDSLQYLAGLSEEERLAIIDGIIQDVIEQEQRKQEEEMLKQRNLMEEPDDFGQIKTGGQWYFYNSGSKSQGYNDFKKKWGNRKLEDLWRLTNKNIVSFGEEEIGDMASDTTEIDTMAMGVQDPKKREYYLQNIPMTEADIKASDDKIIEAYFNLGRLYREGLQNPEKSKKAFETLLDRYPDNKYRLQAYYNLYKIYQEQNDTANANIYKNLVLTNFPDSDYAKVIENPNYFEELAKEKNKVQDLYEKTYEAFKNEQYFLVINYGDIAMSNFKDSEFLPKFEYLRAISLGKVEVADTLALALKQIMVKYPDSKVAEYAANIIKNLKVKKSDQRKSGEKGEEEFASPFSYTPEESHYCAVVVKRPAVNVSALKVRLSDFDKKYFSLRKLNINSVLLGKKEQLVTVGIFKDKEDAMNYYSLITENDYVFGNINPVDYKIFVISSTNYPIFYKQKNVDNYLRFFEREYLNNK